LSAWIWPLLVFAGSPDSLSATNLLNAAESSVVVASAESPWSSSASGTTYFGDTTDLYLVPDVSVEYYGLHVEGRYNYEDLHTGSIFLGWHLEWGDKTAGLDLTPMAGWVTGRTDGVAPALLLDGRAGRFELYNEFEYVFESSDDAFIYDRADFIYNAPAGILVGIVGEHTLTSSEGEFVPGFLVGISSSHLGVTFYLYGPGREDAKGALELELEF
jgi:hypothetical protein